MKKLVVLPFISISSVYASNCSQFDGLYQKSCQVESSRLRSDSLGGALSANPDGQLVVKSLSDCSALTVDPALNGLFAPIYLKAGNYHDGYLEVKKMKTKIQANLIS